MVGRLSGENAEALIHVRPVVVETRHAGPERTPYRRGVTDAKEPAYLRFSREPTIEELPTLALLNEALARRNAEVIGAAYTDRLSDQLSALRSGSCTKIEFENPVGTWLQSTVWEGVHPSTGEPLDGEFWFRMVVAAADKAADETEAWCIADGAAMNLLFAHGDAEMWLQAARSTHSGVERMFQAIRHDSARNGEDAGFWGEEP